MNTAIRLESNNVAQDDKQHNITLRRRNHEKNTRKILICVKITYLDRNKGGKRCRWVILDQKMT